MHDVESEVEEKTFVWPAVLMVKLSYDYFTMLFKKDTKFECERGLPSGYRTVHIAADPEREVVYIFFARDDVDSADLCDPTFILSNFSVYVTS